jgi:hypothetical protein
MPVIKSHYIPADREHQKKDNDYSLFGPITINILDTGEVEIAQRNRGTVTDSTITASPEQWGQLKHTITNYEQ